MKESICKPLFPRLPRSSIEKSRRMTTEIPYSLQKYHVELSNKRSLMRRKTLPNDSEISNKSKIIARSNLQIKDTRQTWRESELKRRLKQERQIGKLQTMCQQLRSWSRSPPQVIPVPVPFYLPMPGLYQPLHSGRFSSIQSSPRQEHISIKPQLQNKIKNLQLKAKRMHRNRKAIKKIGNAILFLIYLRRFNERARKRRAQVFKKYFNEKYQSDKQRVNLIFMEGTRRFVSILIARQQIDLNSEEAKIQKTTAVKKLLKILLQGIYNILSKCSIRQYMYFLCKHGSYSCKAPIHSLQEIEMYSISNHSYLSADANLSKAAIINILFMQGIIFNLLLRKDQQLSKIRNNLMLVMNVLYQVLIEVQDQFMLAVPKAYIIGNSRKKKGIKYCPPMVLQGSTHRQGQIISGFEKQNILKKKYSGHKWQQEKMLIQTLIDNTFQQIIECHKKVNENLY